MTETRLLRTDEIVDGPVGVTCRGHDAEVHEPLDESESPRKLWSETHHADLRTALEQSIGASVRRITQMRLGLCSPLS